jgi:hypothetical protein
MITAEEKPFLSLVKEFNHECEVFLNKIRENR